MDLVNVIIFSKDRPAQLDALLRSIRERVEAWEKRALWSVVFTASTREFARGYEIVRAEHRADAIEIIDERSRSGGFKSIVVDTMQRQHQANGAPWCMFLVDDMIFKASWPLDGGRPMRRLKTDPRVLCLSLRMCPRYDYCYVKNRRVKRPFMAFFGRWNWLKCEGDWRFPMSLDGHIFRHDDIFPLVQQSEFEEPNTFEGKLHQNRIKTRPLMTCYAESVVVNLPVNRVQQVRDSRAGEDHGVSAEELNASFLAGKRVSLAPIYALKDNRGCHHEMPLQLR
jgi:hypothetical protein